MNGAASHTAAYFLSKCLMRCELKEDRFWQFLVSVGRRFQKSGPVTFKALAPESVNVLGTNKEF